MTDEKERGVPEASPRDKLRSALLGDKKRTTAQRRPIVLFGMDIELKQPTFGEMMDLRDLDTGRERAISTVIRYAVVPGTDERIFEEGDRPTIESWPFGEDVMKIQEAVMELTGIDIDDLEKELVKDPLDEPS